VHHRKPSETTAATGRTVSWRGRKCVCTHRRARLLFSVGLPTTTQGGNKREGLPRRVWRCLRLINVNLIQRECRCIHKADAFVLAVLSRLDSLLVAWRAPAIACGCAQMACLETQAAFSVYQVMGKFNWYRHFFLESTFKREKGQNRKGKIFQRRKLNLFLSHFFLFWWIVSAHRLSFL